MNSVKRIAAPEMGPKTTGDLLAILDGLRDEMSAAMRHERLVEPEYERVWLALCDASDGIRIALDAYPA